MKRWNAILLRHTKVVGAESTCDMYNAGTIFGSHIIAGNYTECSFARINPGYELLVVEADKFGAVDCCNHLPGHKFVAGLVVFECYVLGLFVE